MIVNYKILYRHFLIALCRKTPILFAFNADRQLVAGLLQAREEAEHEPEMQRAANSLPGAAVSPSRPLFPFLPAATDGEHDLATTLAVSPTDPCILPRKVISYRYHLDITFLGRVP
jgi:hypothetical protein